MDVVISCGEPFSALAQRWPNPLTCPLVHLHHGADTSLEATASVEVMTLGALSMDARRALDLPGQCAKLYLMHDSAHAEDWSEIREITQLTHECHVVAVCDQELQRSKAARSRSVVSSIRVSRSVSRRSGSPQPPLPPHNERFSRTSRLPA